MRKTKSTKIKKSPLLINLGTPREPNPSAVRKYLSEFLMDKNVIDIPYILRFLLVKIIISPIRSFSSSKSYKTIWDKKKGAPLLSKTKELKKLCEKTTNLPISIGMRYSSPSIREGLLEALKKLNLKNNEYGEIYAIPLYPQYAMSTTKSVMEKTAIELQKIKKTNPQYANALLKFKSPFFNDKQYLDCLKKSLSNEAKKLGKKGGYERMIFSYHGIPVRHLKKNRSYWKPLLQCSRLLQQT